MVTDELAQKTDNKEIIEILVTDGKTKVWIPMMATSVYTVTKGQELNKVEAVKVRKLK